MKTNNGVSHKNVVGEARFCDNDPFSVGKGLISTVLSPEFRANLLANSLYRPKWQLLFSYLLLMETILLLFGGAIFWFLSRDVLEEVDQKLKALAQYAASDLKEYDRQQSDFPANYHSRSLQRDEPFRNSNLAIEWFSQSKLLLDRQGQYFPDTPPQVGLYSLDSGDRPPVFLRSLTLQIRMERSPLALPPLEGYIRISQSLQEINEKNFHRLLILVMAVIGTFVLVTLIGIILTFKATTPAETMVRQLKQFTADASHELRNPLTAIQASIEALRNHPERIHPQDIQKIGIIAHSAEQMTHLVKDLLFLARNDVAVINQGQEWEVIDLNQLIQQLREWLEPVAQEKGVDFEVESRTTVFVRGNRPQLLRLFTNLTENAINYTPTQGHVAIAINLSRYSVQVTISDTGIGIARSELPHVFDRFWRSDEARDRRSSGTGLGLAISQSIAQAHQGNLTVRSQLNLGSCFEVSLPIHGSHPSPQSPQI